MSYTVSSVESLFRYRRHDSITFPIHLHRELEFVFVTDGVLSVSVGNNNYAVPSGSAILIESYEPHSFKTEDYSICYIFEVSLDNCASLSSWLDEYTSETRVAKYPQELFAYLRVLLDLDTVPYSKDRSRYSVLAASAAISELFLDNCKFVPRTDRNTDLLIEALKYISINYREDISLESIARSVGMNPDSFSRKFYANVHMTVSEYVRYIRVSYAATLLLNGLSVSKAAFLSGFASLRTFNRSFRQIVGSSPTEFVKSPKGGYNYLSE